MGLNLQVGASAPAPKESGPRTGTLAWVKHSSKMREYAENRLRNFWS